VIRVRFGPGELTLWGHARYARRGEDIVCAAASALVYALIGALEQARALERLVIRPGYVSLSARGAGDGCRGREDAAAAPSGEPGDGGAAMGRVCPGTGASPAEGASRGKGAPSGGGACDVCGRARASGGCVRDGGAADRRRPGTEDDACPKGGAGDTAAFFAVTRCGLEQLARRYPRCVQVE
jgi:hypothetical protein